MPWFCYGSSSKKTSKTKKSKKKSGRKEIERCQKYVVILKDYVAVTTDEVSVHRGQVVEKLCTKGNWVYIRGNNSSTGYVPLNYTAEVDKSDGSELTTSINLTNDITLVANGNMARLPPSSRSINVGTLHHSGSSITSVEVHQMGGDSVTEFRDSGEGQTMSLPVTLGESSQAIYEDPRCPDGTAEVNLKDESGSAPALPPRALGLPSATEIQQSLTSYRSASNTPHHYRRSPIQRHRPGNLALVTSTAHPCPYHRPRYPYGPFPSKAGEFSRCTCTPTAATPGSASITAATSQPSFLPSGKPLPAATPLTPGSFSQGHSSGTTPGYTPPAWTPPHSAGRRGINGYSPLSQHRHISRHHAATTPGVPQTPGSASLPSATPASPVVSNFAPTPRGSRDFIESLPTKGNGIRVSSSSSTSSCGRRAVSRTPRCRRYSSDLQVHSTISEDNTVTGIQQEAPLRNHAYSRRRSQPCLMINSTHAVNSGSSSNRQNDGSSQQMRRPNALPMRRSLSMHTPHSAGRSSRNSCPCTPQQQQALGQGSADVLMQRAFSCIDAAQMGSEKPISSTAVSNGASRKPEEAAATPQQVFSASAVNMRRRRSRSSSNRLDSVPSIDEEGVQPGASAPDDVFLPEAGKKPVGIFRCIKTCAPRFKGEITLQENEMVIVLDYGMGQWAWVLTATNAEGLVSKSLLEKYRPDGLDTHQGGLASGAVSDGGTVFDDSDSGRGTITKERRSVGVDASTQTAPTMDGELNITRASVSTGLISTGYSTSSTVPTTSENSPLSTAERMESRPARAAKRKRASAVRGLSKEIKDDNMILLEAAATAVAKHAEIQTTAAGSLKRRQQAPPQEWFNTIDSLDDRERIKPYVASRSGSRLPSSSQLLEETSLTSSPPLVELQQPKANAAEVDNASINSKNDGAKGDDGEAQLNANEKTKEKVSPVRSVKNRNMNHRRERKGKADSLTSVALSPARLAAKPADQGQPATNHVQTVKEAIKPGTTHYHDRISGQGSMSYNSQSSSEESPPKLGRQKSRQQIGLSNVLTVVKDYNPAPNSKNCIPIKEGDVLHLQTHMHYPKGWMWVWHTSRRTFGYVPKSYVAYTYDTVRKGRPRINTIEDAV